MGSLLWQIINHLLQLPKHGTCHNRVIQPPIGLHSSSTSTVPRLSVKPGAIVNFDSLREKAVGYTEFLENAANPANMVADPRERHYGQLYMRRDMEEI